MIEQIFDRRVAPGKGVAHQDAIGRRLEVLRGIALLHEDAFRRQLIAHGRIGAGVLTGYLVTELAREDGDARHECTANTQDVQMHLFFSLNLWCFRRGSRRGGRLESGIGFGDNDLRWSALIDGSDHGSGSV